MELFECKVKYDRQCENGIIAKTSEVYLVDAISFTEAEARIISEVEPFISGEFEVANIKKIRVVELIDSIDNNADKWYRARVKYLTFDEKTEKEKATVQNIIVKGCNFQDALSNLQGTLNKGLGDTEVASLTETAILDVFRHEA